MTHFPAPAPPFGHPRLRRPGPTLCLALAVACGVGLAVAPAGAGTVLRGKVTLPATVPARNAKGGGAPDHGELVVYVTEKPGGTALAGRAKRQDVNLAGDRFEPRVLVVNVGSKVRFKNQDRVYHSLFSLTPAGRTEVGSLAPGEKREVRFDRVGVNNLFCQLHPGAAGFVVVCPNWFHTGINAAGEYTLPPLPRGSYVVHAWHPLLGDSQRSVEVTGRDTRRLDLSF
jgi:plastocyanin